jgi:hypothetical protein
VPAVAPARVQGEKGSPAGTGVRAAVKHTRAAIVEALAGRSAAEDVGLALVRLAVIGQVVEADGRYTLAAGDAGPPEVA